MKVKPKEVMMDLPAVLMLPDFYQGLQIATNLNTFIHGKVKVKYEELGIYNNLYVVLYYLQRNDEFAKLRKEFMDMILKEEEELI